MKRLIKFRAWDGEKMDRLWKDGRLVIDASTGEAQKIGYGSTPFNVSIPHGLTLMQYTGLKDRNGVEIYEGDIIKFEEKVLSDNREPSAPHIETKRNDHYVYADKTVGSRVWGHEVICIDDKFGIHDDNLTNYFGYKSPIDIERGEVIGNIYENPQLLEATQ